MPRQPMRFFYFFALFISISVILISSGCSLTSAGIVALNNSNTPDILQIQMTEITQIKNNAVIDIGLRDSTHIHGKFKGLSSVSLGKYKKRYNSFFKKYHDQFNLPQLNDTLILKSSQNSFKFQGNFTGFDFHYIHCDNLGYLHRNPSFLKNIAKKLKPINCDETTFAYPYLTEISADHNTQYSNTQLEYLINSTHVPTRSNIIVENFDFHHEFNRDEINTIYMYNKKPSPWAGFAIGLIIDAWFVYALNHLDFGGIDINLSGM